MNYAGVNTVAELTELISNSDRTVVLLDSGGFVWWSSEDRHGDFWLEGCAGPCDPDDQGLAVRAWMNKMAPEEAVAYGPFMIISLGFENP